MRKIHPKAPMYTHIYPRRLVDMYMVLCFSSSMKCVRICKTKGVRTFGSTAAEIVCRGATLNTLSSFGFNCVYYALRVEG